MSLDPPPDRQCNTTGSRVSSRINSSRCIDSTRSRRAARLSIFSPRRCILKRCRISSSVSSVLIGSLLPRANSRFTLICTCSPDRTRDRISLSSVNAAAPIVTGALSSRDSTGAAPPPPPPPASSPPLCRTTPSTDLQSVSASGSDAAAPASSSIGASISASSSAGSSPSSAPAQ
eukprot:scaffold24512_cov98-Isochrysis_galbana.AAC.1